MFDGSYPSYERLEGIQLSKLEEEMSMVTIPREEAFDHENHGMCVVLGRRICKIIHELTVVVIADSFFTVWP